MQTRTPYIRGRREEAFAWVVLVVSGLAGGLLAFATTDSTAVFAYAFFSFTCGLVIFSFRRFRPPGSRPFRDSEHRLLRALTITACICGIVLLGQESRNEPLSPTTLIPLVIAVLALGVAAVLDIRTCPSHPPRADDAVLRVWRGAAARIGGLTLAGAALLGAWIASPFLASTRGATCEPRDVSGCDSVGHVLIGVFYVAPLVLIIPFALIIRLVIKTSSRAREASRNGDDAAGLGHPS